MQTLNWRLQCENIHKSLRDDMLMLHIFGRAIIVKLFNKPLESTLITSRDSST